MTTNATPALTRLTPKVFSPLAWLQGVFCLCLGLSAEASDSFQLVSGDVAQGSIIRADATGCTILLDGGGTHTVTTEELAPESIPLLNAWKSANPELSNVYMKFDKPPVPKRTVQPDSSDLPNGVSGMISVGIIVDDDGEVVDVNVIRSQHEALEEPTVDAVSRWVFEPARVGSNPVFCYIVVPVRFK